MLGVGSLCHHLVRLVPSITRCHFTPSPLRSDVCPGWILSQILIVFYAPVHSVYKGKKPPLLALYARQLSLTQMFFSNRNKQMQSQSCFLCKSLWNTSKHIFCLTIWPAQGDRLAELWKCLSDCFAEYFLSLSIEKNCKGEHQSEEFICVTNEEDSYLFLVVMKFAKLLMSALVSLSDDLVPVELFHLSC